LNNNEVSSLNGKLRRELKSRAKTRPVDVRIGKKGLTDNVIAELRKVFEKEDLAKVAFTQDKDARASLLADIEDKLVAASIAVTGKTATLYKPLPSRK
jgi:RNA-binding protein